MTVFCAPQEYGSPGGGGGRSGREEDELHDVPPEAYGEEAALGAHAAIAAFTKNWLVLLFKASSAVGGVQREFDGCMCKIFKILSVGICPVIIGQFYALTLLWTL